MIRKSLDRLYLFSGALASLLIAAICLLVCAQVALNLVTRLGLTACPYPCGGYLSGSRWQLLA